MFQPPRLENGDKVALYPRQRRPEGYTSPRLIKPKQNANFLDLLTSDPNNGRRKSGLDAAMAAFNNVKGSSNTESGSTTSPTDFISHWQNLAVAQKAHEESLAQRMDAILANVKMEGFKQASQAKTWKVKTLWLILIFLLFSITFYESLQCLKAYYGSPITTRYQLLTPDAIDFPQVYLCYGSSFNHSYISQHRDQMDIATAYRSRSAVTKGGNNRRKREIDVWPDATLDDDHDRVVRALSAAADKEEDEWDRSEFEAHAFERLRRSVVGAERNSSSNGSVAAAMSKASAEAAAAKAAKARIEALMNSTNISEIVYQYFHEASFKVRETFLECGFHTYTNQKLDCEDIVKPIMDANYGMCYLVTIPDDLKQTVAGNGLRLLMNSQIALYPKENEGAPRYAGILVSVNKQYDPFNWLKSLAAPGRMTKIDLEASYVELLDLEDGPTLLGRRSKFAMIQRCVDDDKGRALLRIFNSNYSRTLCQMDCVYQAHRNHCRCILPVDKRQVKDEILNDTSFCGPVDFKGCLAVSADIMDEEVGACRNRCYTPCKSYRYDMRSSTARLNERAFSRSSLPPNASVKDLIELRVAHSRKEIIQLIQSPSASLADLCSNGGGQINLWLGASLVSLLQMLFYAFRFVILRVFAQIRKFT